jgi:hypothetical protein
MKLPFCVPLFAAILGAQEHPLVFTHVTVIDATGQAAAKDRTVVVANRRIELIGTSEKTQVPKGAVVVDGTGRFLIPGLWDMHIHLRGGADLIPDNEASLTLYLVNGIVGVREMGGDIPETVFKWRSESAAGTRLGPRIISSGPKIDGPKPAWPGSIPVTTPEEARAAVRKLKAMGSDLVKSYSASYPHDVFAALTDEARRQGLRIGGHLPYSETVRDAVDSGFTLLEHLSGAVLSGCSSVEAEVDRQLMARIESGRLGPLAERRALFLEGCDELRARDLVRFLAKNKDVWVTPTLAVGIELASMESSNYASDPRRKYILPGLWNSWDPQAGRRRQPSAEDRQRWGLIHQREAMLMKTLATENAQVLAGSDSGASNNFTFPGWTLHRELAAMVEAGYTPMQALQAATRNPARYLGELDRMGTLEVGKAASLVLLNANPLDDVRNTQKIEAVVLNGRLLRRADLDQMLADVAAKGVR